MENGLSPPSSHAIRGEMPLSGQLKAVTLGWLLNIVDLVSNTRHQNSLLHLPSCVRSAALQGSAGQAIPCLGRRREVQRQIADRMFTWTFLLIKV
jgi:hypothetical protein